MTLCETCRTQTLCPGPANMKYLQGGEIVLRVDLKCVAYGLYIVCYRCSGKYLFFFVFACCFYFVVDVSLIVYV